MIKSSAKKHQGGPGDSLALARGGNLPGLASLLAVLEELAGRVERLRDGDAVPFTYSDEEIPGALRPLVAAADADGAGGAPLPWKAASKAIDAALNALRGPRDLCICVDVLSRYLHLELERAGLIAPRAEGWAPLPVQHTPPN